MAKGVIGRQFAIQRPRGLKFPVNIHHLLIATDVIKTVSLENDGVVVCQRLNEKESVAHVADEILKQGNKLFEGAHSRPHLPRRKTSPHCRLFSSEVARCRAEMRGVAILI